MVFNKLPRIPRFWIVTLVHKNRFRCLNLSVLTTKVLPSCESNSNIFVNFINRKNSWNKEKPGKFLEIRATPLNSAILPYELTSLLHVQAWAPSRKVEDSKELTPPWCKKIGINHFKGIMLPYQQTETQRHWWNQRMNVMHATCLHN